MNQGGFLCVKQNENGKYYLDGKVINTHYCSARNLFLKKDKEFYKLLSKKSTKSIRKAKYRSIQAFCMGVFTKYLHLVMDQVLIGKTFIMPTSKHCTLKLETLTDDQLRRYRQRGMYMDYDLYAIDYKVQLPYIKWNSRVTKADNKRLIRVSRERYLEFVDRCNSNTLESGLMKFNDPILVEQLENYFNFEWSLLKEIIKKGTSRMVGLLISSGHDFHFPTSPSTSFLTIAKRQYNPYIEAGRAYQLYKKKVFNLDGSELSTTGKRQYYTYIRKCDFDKYIANDKNGIFANLNEVSNTLIYKSLVPIIKPNYYIYKVELNELDFYKQGFNIIKETGFSILIEGYIPSKLVKHINTFNIEQFKNYDKFWDQYNYYKDKYKSNGNKRQPSK